MKKIKLTGFKASGLKKLISAQLRNVEEQRMLPQ